MRPAAALLVLLVSCSRPAPSKGGAPDAAPPAAAPRYGEVMAEVGRRFEAAGRAASANRFELAAFEVGELEELFTGDLGHADLPREGPTAQLPAMAQAFVQTFPPELAKAAKAKDARAFADAFRRASESCNGCHQASGHGFIEVPSVPGKAVPDLDPLPAP
jgi:hypothetical protein